MGEFEILDTDEPLAKRMERHAYDRLIMLSDGVFAIAITLAALELKIPDPFQGSVTELLARMARPLSAYAISFGVIGVYWIAHRRMIARMRRVDAVFTGLNLALLAVVALQPLAVQVLMKNGPNSGAGQLYFWQVVTIGVLQSLLWGYGGFVAKLVDNSISPAARWFVFAMSLLLPALGCGLGLYAGTQSNLSLLLVLGAVVGLVLGRRWLGKRLGV